MTSYVYHTDNLPFLKKLPDESITLIYIDPPFNTGEKQQMKRLKTVRDEKGDRVGFKGQRYKSVHDKTISFADKFTNYEEFLKPRLEEARRVLAPNGTLYFHIDYREVHYCKVLLDVIFGRDCFMNEIIWAFDYGARTKSRWSPKHNNILVYVKDPKNYIFNHEEIERIPYMAPGLVSEEKARKGKLPTDTWWHTIVPTNGKERTGYPNQKPLGILRRVLTAASNPGDRVMDFFAGSGSFGEAAHELGRPFIMVDDHEEAIKVMKKRFDGREDIQFRKGADQILLPEAVSGPS